MVYAINVLILFENTSRKKPQKEFYKKVVPKNFAKFKGKDLCRSLKKIPTQLFPVNFGKFSGIPFLQDTSGRLLLSKDQF